MSVVKDLKGYIPQGDGYNSHFAHTLTAAVEEIEALRSQVLKLEADHETGAGKAEQLLAALKEARAAIVCRTFDESALAVIDAAIALDDREA